MRVKAIQFLLNFRKGNEVFFVLKNDVEKVKKSGPRRPVCLHDRFTYTLNFKNINFKKLQNLLYRQIFYS